jgi:signal transduction histidine kinase
MKRATIEPGLLQVLRLYVVVAAVLLPVIWRIYSPMLGNQADLGQFIRPNLPLLVFLAVYTTFPWWQQRMGRAFLPVALILFAVQALLGNYLTLQWLVQPSLQELAMLTFLLRLWITFQFLVLFVAWQYDLFWVMVSGVTLCLLDAVLAFPFVNVGGMLYPFFATIVVGRLIAVTSVGMALAWLMKSQREHRAALSDANAKLRQYAVAAEQLAASQERNRLARELHDTLAHSLSGVTVQLEAVEALWDVNVRSARHMLDQALASTRSGLTEARRALQSLRASPLEDLGLALAVSDLAKSVAARANVKLDLDVEHPLENIPLEVEQSIYRIAQEALTNVTRHANATTVRVGLRRERGQLTLVVADNGRGFDTTRANGAHYGLRGLRERADMAGGTLHIESGVQQGTTIHLTIPIGDMLI